MSASPYKRPKRDVRYQQPGQGEYPEIAQSFEPMIPKVPRYVGREELLSRLLSIDWSATHEVKLFANEFFLRGEDFRKPKCEPIHLGDEQGYFYYLRPGIVELRHDQSDYENHDAERLHYAFLKLVYNDGKACPLRYKFGLGSLTWSYYGPKTSEFKDPNKHTNTPFAAVLDVERLMVFLVCLPYFIEGDEYNVEMEDSMNIWEFLPSDPLGRRSFKLIKLMDLNELGKTQSYSPFNNTALKTSIDKMVIDRVVLEDEVNMYIKKAQEKRKSLQK